MAAFLNAAEEYHQNDYQQNPLRYRFYRSSCGRGRRLREIWGRRGRRIVSTHRTVCSLKAGYGTCARVMSLHLLMSWNATAQHCVPLLYRDE